MSQIEWNVQKHHKIVSIDNKLVGSNPSQLLGPNDQFFVILYLNIASVHCAPFKLKVVIIFNIKTSIRFIIVNSKLYERLLN